MSGNSARIQFRKAQLQAKRNTELARRKERELLFAGARDGSPISSSGRRKGQERLTQDDQAKSAADELTAALLRTRQLIVGEVNRSHAANQKLGKLPDKL
jgi:protein transport protein SEC20